MQLQPTHFTVIVRRGREILVKRMFSDYNEAMSNRDELERSYPGYWIDFRTHY